MFLIDAVYTLFCVCAEEGILNVDGSHTIEKEDFALDRAIGVLSVASSGELGRV